MNQESARWLFRWLLQAYPAEFRREFGQEMEAVFREALAEAAQDGQWRVLACLVRELAHAPGLAARAHWQAWGNRSAGTGTTQREMGMTTPLKIIVYGLLPLLLAVLGWWISRFLGGAGFGTLATAWAAAGWLFAPALVWAVQRLNPGVWIGAGLALLGALTVPGIASYYTGEFLAEYAVSPLPGYALWIPPAAVIVGVILLQNAIRLFGLPTADGATTSGSVMNSRRALLCALLGTLLLARTVHYLYWLLVWDLTTDPLHWYWIVLPMLAALTSGVVLISTLPGRRRVATACALLIPVLLATTYTLSQRVDYRTLTEQRAARAAQAIRVYHDHTGHYPATLSQAQLWSALPLAGPVIIYGQEWCYDATTDSYQLGYVDRDHWSSPYLIGRLASAAGKAASPQTICDAEITAVIERQPRFSRPAP